MKQSILMNRILLKLASVSKEVGPHHYRRESLFPPQKLAISFTAPDLVEIRHFDVGIVWISHHLFEGTLSGLFWKDPIQVSAHSRAELPEGLHLENMLAVLAVHVFIASVRSGGTGVQSMLGLGITMIPRRVVSINVLWKSCQGNLRKVLICFSLCFFQQWQSVILITFYLSCATLLVCPTCR